MKREIAFYAFIVKDKEWNMKWKSTNNNNNECVCVCDSDWRQHNFEIENDTIANALSSFARSLNSAELQMSKCQLNMKSPLAAASYAAHDAFKLFSIVVMAVWKKSCKFLIDA